ncbi:MAG: ATP-binding protein [Promethearchaeota archaeon]
MKVAIVYLTGTGTTGKFAAEITTGFRQLGRRWQMALVEGKKRVDPLLCTGCGLCATRICPAGAITLDASSRTTFKRFKCIGCEGCVNLCPQLAIWTK